MIPPRRDPPGLPPPPILAGLDAVLGYALGELWPDTGAREQAELRTLLAPLQAWARKRYKVKADE